MPGRVVEKIGDSFGTAMHEMKWDGRDETKGVKFRQDKQGWDETRPDRQDQRRWDAMR